MTLAHDAGRRWELSHRRSGAPGRHRLEAPSGRLTAVTGTVRPLVVGVTRFAVALALAAVAVVGLGLAVGPRTGAYRTVTMLTGSMRPGMPVGSVLVVRPQPIEQLRPGQVLTYAIPVDDRRVVSHRVVSVAPAKDGGYDVVTKGDANNGRDPWTAHVADRTVWTVRAVIPHLGSALLALRDPRLLPWLLYAGPALCAAWVLVGVWRTT